MDLINLKDDIEVLLKGLNELLDRVDGITITINLKKKEKDEKVHTIDKSNLSCDSMSRPNRL